MGSQKSSIFQKGTRSIFKARSWLGWAGRPEKKKKKLAGAPKSENSAIFINKLQRGGNR